MQLRIARQLTTIADAGGPDGWSTRNTHQPAGRAANNPITRPFMAKLILSGSFRMVTNCLNGPVLERARQEAMSPMLMSAGGAEKAAELAGCIWSARIVLRSQTKPMTERAFETVSDVGDAGFRATRARATSIAPRWATG